MPELSEQEIIQGCRDKNRTIQEYLYKKNYSLFLKICARYARDMEDAEQLLNDGFLKIFLRIDAYSGHGSFEGWMKKILVHTCLDYLRSKYLKTAMQMNFNAEKITENAVSYNTEGIDRIQFKELATMIQSLPAMTRTVFNLFVFEGFSHKEISGLLEISEGTSHWHVSNGRSLLQKKNKIVTQEKSFHEKRI